MLKNFINSKRNLSSLIHIIYLRNKKKNYIKKTKGHNKAKIIKQKNIVMKESNNSFKSLILNEKSLIKKNKDYILLQSNSILNNYILSISGEYMYVGRELDWNKDYINNYIWEISHYSEIKTKDFSNNADVKNVWEFSRFYFLTTLAKALYLTSEIRYFMKIEEKITEWNVQNPINMSVNWTVGMEVAIRSVNLIEIYNLLKATKLTSNEEQKLNLENKILKQILSHKIFLENNLEKGLNSNNHYLSNLVGLIYINLFLNAVITKSKRISNEKKLQLLLKELDKELHYQIYNDGFSYEDSISYHALNLEMIISVLNLLKINKHNVLRVQEVSDIEQTVYKMFKALQAVMIEGSIPVIGDIDNGRLLIFDESSNKDKTSFEYLLGICSKYFEEETNDSSLEKRYLGYPDSGLYKYKFSDYILFFKCGRIGQNGLGGHAHNDQLSILLYVKNLPFFIDPGTGNYTSDKSIRNFLRSTKSHNTLEIVDLEQNDINFDVFKMKERTFSSVLKISEFGIRGTHKGYVRDIGSECIRELIFENETIIIIDHLEKFIHQKVNINFILDEKIIINQTDEKTCELSRDGIKISFKTEKGYITFKEVIYSNNYGIVRNTNKLTINFDEGFSENKVEINQF